MLTVTFRYYKSGREWCARFDLGTDRDNFLRALAVAWKSNSEIVAASDDAR